MKRKMCGRPLLSCLLAVLLCIGAAPAQAAETPASEKSGAVNWVETVDEGILPEPVEIPIDFPSLQAQNPDVYAWIQVPGTEVDYPILQSPDDNGYYLDHDINKSEAAAGAIFTENYNTKTF